MRPNIRLIWCLVVVIGSSLYAVLVATNPNVASAVVLGYVAVLLTIFVLNEVWRRS